MRYVMLCVTTVICAVISVLVPAGRCIELSDIIATSSGRFTHSSASKVVSEEFRGESSRTVKTQRQVGSVLASDYLPPIKDVPLPPLQYQLPDTQSSTTAGQAGTRKITVSKLPLSYMPPSLPHEYLPPHRNLVPPHTPIHTVDSTLKSASSNPLKSSLISITAGLQSAKRESSAFFSNKDTTPHSHMTSFRVPERTKTKHNKIQQISPTEYDDSVQQTNTKPSTRSNIANHNKSSQLFKISSLPKTVQVPSRTHTTDDTAEHTTQPPTLQPSVSNPTHKYVITKTTQTRDITVKSTAKKTHSSTEPLKSIGNMSGKDQINEQNYHPNRSTMKHRKTTHSNSQLTSHPHQTIKNIIKATLKNHEKVHLTLTDAQRDWRPTSPVVAVLFTELNGKHGFCDHFCPAPTHPISTDRQTANKCPPKTADASRQNRNCTHECSNRLPCPRGFICCRQSCARACVRPWIVCDDLQCQPHQVCIQHNDGEARCADTRPKPGRCPLNTSRTNTWARHQLQEECADECHFDADCRASQKCCHDGCGHTCQPADTRLTCDQVQCSNGSDEVCVSHPTRDARCVSVRPHRGQCPPHTGQSATASDRGQCGRSQCQLDSECGSREKCCFNGCRHQCVPALTRITCDNVICKSRETCIERATEDARCVSNIARPGECPRGEITSTTRAAECEKECRVDEQCPPDHKCCLQGCSALCIPAKHKITCKSLRCPLSKRCVEHIQQDARCVSTTPKPGRCARTNAAGKLPIIGAKNQCKDNCTLDEECPDKQKCCLRNCSRVCTDPDTRKLCRRLKCNKHEQCVQPKNADAFCVNAKPKPGSCPTINKFNDVGRSCNQTCQYDEQCANNNKCCYNGCAKKCTEPRPNCETKICKIGEKCRIDLNGIPQCNPIPCRQDGEVVDIECNSCTCIQGFLLCSQEECPPVKPGFCPRLVRGYRGQCSESCSSDYDCSGDDKCCSTGCGRACKQPTLSIVHPCKTVRFRCGNETHCAATRGLCQPGRPCPLVPLCVSRSAPFCESCPEGKVCILQKRPCPHGHCERQPICVQLYSDDTPFQENDEVKEQIALKQQLQEATNRL